MAIYLYRCFKMLGLLAAALTVVLSTKIHAQETLRVLAWPGYADADLVKLFEQRTGSKVQVTVIDSDDVMWQKLGKASSEQFDVFAVNTAELQRYVRSGVAVPVDIAEIPNVSRQLPRFRDLKNISGLVHGNSVYGIPYTYAEMGLIYDRQQIKEPPTSIDVLWDPRYRGKVLLYNGGSHNFSLAAQTLGTATPFRIGDKEWPATVDKLISLRRNAQGFYSQPDESVNLFKKGRTALMFANYGSQQMKMLTIAGIEVGYTVPVEGALAWLDCWAITSNAKNIKLALAWINFFLGPQAGVALLTRQGLANTTSESPYLRPQDRLKWLEPVEDVDRRNRLWERIIAGDRASKVLAP